MVSFNANGSFTYTPATGFSGTDLFTYKANDGKSQSNTVAVTITVTPLNQAPVAHNDAYSVQSGNILSVPAPGVLANDTDVEGSPLTAALISSVSSGSLTFNSDGSFSYTSSVSFTGSVTFTYRASDGSKESDLATVNLGVYPPPAAGGGTTSRVSVSSAGVQGDAISANPSISADGRYVVFYSSSSNLVSPATSGNQVFLRDLQTGQTTLVSVNRTGASGNGSSSVCAISGDGRYVAFYSSATDLVSPDTSGNNIFRRDLQTGQTVLVSVNKDGGPADGDSYIPGISYDGRYVSFASYARNLVSGTTNSYKQIFVRDMQAGVTSLVSISNTGVPAANDSNYPAISADGHFVTFMSSANNLVSADNGYDDLFIRDVQTGVTSLISVRTNPNLPNRSSGSFYWSSVSGDGRYVVYDSTARDLVAAATTSQQIYLYDRQTGVTALVTVNAGATVGNGSSQAPVISPDGRYIIYNSSAVNLVEGDTNNWQDIFLYDHQTARTTLVSLSSGAQLGNNNAQVRSALSADGRFVAFASNASNLVTGDTNTVSDVFVHDRNSAMIPSALQYTGLSRGINGGQVQLKAVLTDSNTQQGLPYQLLNFNLSGLSGSAVTDSFGLATLNLPLNLTTGVYSLSIQYTGSGSVQSSQIAVDFTVVQNQPPVSSPGGPYVVPRDGSVVLDGSSSTENDPGDMITAYSWDLNNDGVFGDVKGAVPAPLSWSQVVSLVCDGSCSATQPYPIALEVTDSAGLKGTGTTTLTVNLDFTLSLNPQFQAISPGSTNAFAVNVLGVGGFDIPVILSLRDAPDWLAASFEPNPVLPGNYSVLTLTAAQDAPGGEFSLTVVGTGGGLTREASSTTRIAFGLIPVCYGALEGYVTDSVTGTPLVGVNVLGTPSNVITDAAGYYNINHLSLAADNGPQVYPLQVNPENYWVQNKGATGICGVVTRTDFQMLKKKFAQIAGSVMEGTVNPGDGTVTSTDLPISGAQVKAGSTTVTTQDNGTYATGSLELTYNNVPREYSVQVDQEGYWPAESRVTISADQTETVDFALVQKCSATITGTILTEDINLVQTPLPNTKVWAVLDSSRATASWGASSSGSGAFSFKGVSVDYNNAAGSYWFAYGNFGDPVPSYLWQKADGSWVSSAALVPEVKCGETLNVRVVITLPPPVPEPVYGIMEGYVTDSVTNLPVPLAQIQGQYIPGAYDNGTTGFYHIENVTAGNLYVTVQAPGYWELNEKVTINQNEITQKNFSMVAIKYGTIQGTIQDATNHSLLSGSKVELTGMSGFDNISDMNGHYQVSRIAPDSDNQPCSVTESVSLEGYWTQLKVVEINPGNSVTSDFTLIKKCKLATLSGIVVNAYTQQPIQGASVSAGGRSVTTDTGGFFLLANYEPGYNNSPIQLAVTASAQGFLSQTRIITIFCGASISLDFGRPETDFGTIVGQVTRNGQPLSGVFIGSGFGVSDITDELGNYTLAEAPLGANGADRTWQITTEYPGMDPVMQTATVSAGQETRLDFNFNINEAPGITSHPISQTVKAGDSVSFTVAATGYPVPTIRWQETPAADNWTDIEGATAETYSFTARLSDDSHRYRAVFSNGIGVPVMTNEAALTVNPAINNPPAVEAGDSATINEGGTFRREGSFSDNDSSSWVASVDYGDGAGTQVLTLSGKTFSLNHVYADNGLFTVTVNVTDNDGGTGSDTASVSVTNVAPVVNAGSAANILEGGTFASSGTFTDPGADNWTAAVDYGDGSGSQVLTLSGKTFSLNKVYSNNGVYTVLVSVTDNASAAGTDTVLVTVNNVVPVVNAGTDVSVTLGSSFNGTGFFTDPGVDNWTATVDYGDGSGAQPLSLSLNKTFKLSRVYTAAGNYNVAVRIADDVGYGSDTLMVTVTSSVSPVGGASSESAGYYSSPAADLSITQSISSDAVKSGMEVTYQLNVNNEGPSTATLPIVTFNLPFGVTFVSASGNGWALNQSGQVLTFTREDPLNVGAAPLITIKVMVSASAGTLINQASIRADQSDLNQANNTDTISTVLTSVQPAPVSTVPSGAVAEKIVPPSPALPVTPAPTTGAPSLPVVAITPSISPAALPVAASATFSWWLLALIIMVVVATAWFFFVIIHRRKKDKKKDA